MSRKAQTTLTFAVKMKIPPKMTVPEVQRAIRDGILTGSSLPIMPEDFTVALLRKETEYGKR